MSFTDSFRAARWIRFTNLLLQAVLFLALFGGFNYIALNHAWRFDLTRGHRYSLSEESKAYLRGLEREVKITVTLTEDSENEELAQAFRDVSGLLREYSYLTRDNPGGKIVVRYLNVYQNRHDAETLGIDEPNVVVLTSGENGHHVLKLMDFYKMTKGGKREAFTGESALTAAILDVSSLSKKKIYFLSGHGEMQPDDVGVLRGLSQLRDELSKRNFEIAILDLNLLHKVPDDAALVIVPSPQGPLQPFEEELLRNYLTTRAGRLILMLDPARAHGLSNLTEDWGILVFDNVIVDPDPQSYTDNKDLRLWHFRPDASHITDSVLNNTLPLLVGSARTVGEERGRAASDGLSVKTLVATSPKAWGERNYNRVPFEYNPDQDMHGELGVMVISERLQPASNLPLSVRGGRLVVFGTADLVTNKRIFTIGNLNLFIATINWAVDRDTQLSIKPFQIERFQLALSQEELVRLRLGLLLVVPGLVALLGFIVYLTRRN